MSQHVGSGVLGQHLVKVVEIFLGRTGQRQLGTMVWVRWRLDEENGEREEYFR